jgi:hypothetical protein
VNAHTLKQFTIAAVAEADASATTLLDDACGKQDEQMSQASPRKAL